MGLQRGRKIIIEKLRVPKFEICFGGFKTINIMIH